MKILAINKIICKLKMKRIFVNIILVVFFSLPFILKGCSNPSVDFTTEEVVFRNNLDGAILSGTFTKPVGKDKFPIAVLISGAGQQDRDETVYGHKPFKVLAEFLSNNGIGVLRYDDRGIGKSTGNVWNATLEVQASDAYAGIKYLKSRNDIDNNQIGIIGHSLGAMQGTILVSKYPDISFLVLLGGIGIPWIENHIEADKLSNTIKGEPIEIIEAGTTLLKTLCDEMKQTPDSQSYQITKNKLIHIVEEWQLSLKGIAKTKIEEFIKSNPAFFINTIAEEYSTPIYISCAKFEPLKYLTNIKCPVLSIIGDKDVQVISENNDAIKNSLEKSGNNNHKIITPKNINHMMQKCETGLISEYADIDEDFNLKIMIEISEWIIEKTNTK